MSKSHLQDIKILLNKKSFVQNDVKKIENHFRKMSDIQGERNNPQEIKRQRQETFDNFLEKVNSDKTYTITLTAEELTPKGIDYKISFANQETEVLETLKAWMQTATDFYARLSYMLSDDLFEEYAGKKEQEPQNIELDAMERGKSPSQEPEHQEEVVTPANDDNDDNDDNIDENLAIASDVSNSSSSSSETSTMLEPQLSQEFSIVSSESVISESNHDTLKLTINNACSVLQAYLIDDDKQAFEELNKDMIEVIDNLSPNPNGTSIDKEKMMKNINALQDKLKPEKFNIQSQGGLNKELESRWFTVKFWLFSTFKSILNAVGLRSSANFFTPAPSKAEQDEFNENFLNLKCAVDQFENILKDSNPDPDSDSESKFDSNRRIF